MKIAIIVWLCLLPALTFAQKQTDVLKILKKTQQTYQAVKTISGAVEIRIGSPEPGTDMLVGQITGQICLKRVEADTSFGWYFVNEFNIKDIEEGYKVYYAGDSLAYFNLEDSTLERREAQDANAEWGFSTFDGWRKKVNLFYDRLCLPDSIFEKQEEAWLTGDISLGRDTIIGGHACYVIENHQSVERPELQVDFHDFERLAIDKRDYLPVFHYKHFTRNVKGKTNIDQINQVILSDWKLNKKVDDSIFQLQEKVKFKQQKEIIELQVGDLVPNWKLTGINGESLSLYELKKERIILEFSYIGCGEPVL